MSHFETWSPLGGGEDSTAGNYEFPGFRSRAHSICPENRRGKMALDPMILQGYRNYFNSHDIVNERTNSERKRYMKKESLLIKVLKFISDNSKVGNKELIEHFKINKRTAPKLLGRLKSFGWIKDTSDNVWPPKQGHMYCPGAWVVTEAGQARLEQETNNEKAA